MYSFFIGVEEQVIYVLIEQESFLNKQIWLEYNTFVLRVLRSLNK